jgi:SPP1 gp7 family putative phage head morphogenesis protein
MRFNLAAQIQRPSRRPIALPVIITTKAQASDLAAIYMRVARHWQAALPAINGAYQQTLEQTLQTDTAEEVGANINSVAASIQRLLVLLTPELRDWAVRVETWHRGKWARGALSVAGVDISTQIGAADVRETIETFMQRNVALVRDVSDQVRNRISDTVFRGLQQRTPAREVAKEISEAVGMARRRALNIAADQTVKLSSALDAERQRQAGLDHWKWRSSHKLHFRPEHRARDGKLYTDKTAPKDLPGQLPFCGCTRQGVVVFGDE